MSPDLITTADQNTYVTDPVYLRVSQDDLWIRWNGNETAGCVEFVNGNHTANYLSGSGWINEGFAVEPVHFGYGSQSYPNMLWTRSYSSFFNNTFYLCSRENTWARTWHYVNRIYGFPDGWAVFEYETYLTGGLNGSDGTSFGGCSRFLATAREVTVW